MNSSQFCPFPCNRPSFVSNLFDSKNFDPVTAFASFSMNEFRTAPLWGLGQRIFFLHDGRTNDLAEAIQAHRSRANATYPASEANGVINKYNDLRERDKQDLLNFLRSL